MKMSLELSAGLFEARRIVNDYAEGRLELTPAVMKSFEGILMDFGMLARKLENEVSRHRWNEAARQDRVRAAVVVEELSRPDTNVTLFPVVSRPIATEARQ